MIRQRFKKAPPETIAALDAWIQQKRRLTLPDPRLLTENLENWLRAVLKAQFSGPPSNPHIVLTFQKPFGDGSTERLCDPEFLAVALIHVIHGGSFSIEDHMEKYYWRIGVRLKKGNRRVYALRLVVGTEAGHLTKEAKTFRDLRRTSLGRLLRSNDSGQYHGTHGRKEMTEWSLAKLSELPKGRPTLCSTPAEFRALINEAYTWLDAIPLGTAVPPVAEAAE